MSDLERLNELRALHYGDGIYACEKCRTPLTAGGCDTQYALRAGFGLLYRVAELEAVIREVLADEETGEGGWGPDITMALRLKEVLGAKP